MKHRQLAELPTTNGYEIRRRLVAELVGAVDCPAAGTFSVTLQQEVPYFRDFHVGGCERTVSPFQKLAGGPVPPGAVGHPRGIDAKTRPWSIAAPHVRNRDRFALFAEDYVLSLAELSHATDLSIIADCYRPAGISDQMRALVYDGDRFLGWTACFQTGGSRFGLEAQGTAQRLMPRLKALLRAAEACDQSLQTAYAVFDARGVVQSCSQLLSQALDESQLAALAHHVRRLDAGDGSTSPNFIFGGLTATFVQLTAERSTRYLACLTRPALLRICPLYGLSARQQELARILAQGATISEAAQQLELSTGTVSSHLKVIYRRLGINSRLALRQQVQAAEIQRLSSGVIVDDQRLQGSAGALENGKLGP